MLPKRSFKPAKCKTALNLAKSRLKLMKNKKDIQLKQLRKEVAQLLETGHDQTARIRVEHVVREEKTIDAYEMIGIYCELVVARLPIIESQKNCPLDLKEAIASLVFAAPRCGDIVELQDIRKHFTAKYGKEFVTAAVELRPDCGVSRSLIEKLSVKAPDGPTKVKILTAIAEEHNIKWEPNWFKDEDPMPSVEIAKIPPTLTMEDSKIQMQPLNFEIADDLEEKHVHDKTRPGPSFQSHSHSSNNLVSSSSTSHPDSRPPESSSEKMEFNQSSQTDESAFTAGRHNWNMEFKDATAAAQAAAESAELASRAARAAAHFSRHSHAMGDSSAGPGLPNVHGQNEDNRPNVESGLQHNQVHGNTNNSSFNQRIPYTQNQGDVRRQGSMTDEGDSTTLKNDYTQYEAQREAVRKDIKESENSRRQASDFDSGPSISGGEPSISRPSVFQDYETEPSENPFYEETVDRKNHSSSFKSQSSAFGDEFGDFANSKYDDYEHDSCGGSFGSFSRNPVDQEDWHVRSANTYGDEGLIFKNHSVGNSVLESGREYGYDSHNDIFVETDRRTGKGIYEKGIDTNAEVAFDESDSDDDDIYTSNAAVEHNFSSPVDASQSSSLTQDKPHYECGLSESFKRSPMYSKLTEPLPVTFDDSDGESLGSEKELEGGDRKYSTFDYQKSDVDPHLQNMKYVEKGNADSFTSNNHVDKSQNRYYGSVSEHKYSDDTLASEPPYNQANSVAMSTDIKSRSYDGLFDEGGSKKSLQSLRVSESGHLVSKSDYETQPRPEGGMELNLGSLPGGRRNKPHLRSSGSGLADASSPSRSTEMAPSDSLDSTGKASHKFQVSASQMDNEKILGAHTHYDSPYDGTEVVSTRKGSASAGRPFRPTINENASNFSLKDPTGYFVNDESSSEEDVPRPVINRTSVGGGLSRRTKGSAPRAFARSEATSAITKTVPSSSSYTNEVSSPKTIAHSSLDGPASNHDMKINTSKAVKPTTTKSSNVPDASSFNEKAPTKEKLSKKPSHVHPKLPDFETFTATLQSLRENRL